MSELYLIGSDEHYIAECSHDFQARDSSELSMRKGQTLRLAPKHLQPPGIRGWLLASSSSSLVSSSVTFDSELDSSNAMYKAGLVPANRIKVLGRRMGASEEQFQEREKPDIVKSSNN